MCTTFILGKMTRIMIFYPFGKISFDHSNVDSIFLSNLLTDLKIVITTIKRTIGLFREKQVNYAEKGGA